MSTNYSGNWKHIKSILVGYDADNHRLEHESYEDHVHAKALSIFLAHATLATPKLDKSTVEDILTGKQFWPGKLEKDQFKNNGITLAMLEEYGLVSFDAGWCTLHCQGVRNLDNVDPSIIPLIEAVEHLRDIMYEQNTYINPHFACPENEFISLCAENFGSKPIAELLPVLYLEKGKFRLPPDNRNFNPLVSTYLWLELRKSLKPQPAFEKWILCLRVNCSWCIPPLFSDMAHEEKTEFQRQLFNYLSQEPELSKSMSSLQKRAINEINFSGILTPSHTITNITIDTDGSSKDEIETKKLEKPH